MKTDDPLERILSFRSELSVALAKLLSHKTLFGMSLSNCLLVFLPIFFLSCSLLSSCHLTLVYLLLWQCETVQLDFSITFDYYSILFWTCTNDYISKNSFLFFSKYICIYITYYILSYITLVSSLSPPPSVFLPPYLYHRLIPLCHPSEKE